MNFNVVYCVVVYNFHNNVIVVWIVFYNYKLTKRTNNIYMNSFQYYPYTSSGKTPCGTVCPVC